MGPESSASLREGDHVLVRGKVELVGSGAGLIRLTTDLTGGHRKIEMPYTEIFLADYSTNAAYEATRVAVQRADQLMTILLRVQAELYELGLHAGDGKKGLILG